MRMRALLFAGLAVVAGAALEAQAFTKDSLVWKKCADCHAPTADGKLSRVEELRTTPEEWTVIIDRMKRIHKMPLTKDEMAGLLKELCATQILTPEEQAKVSYLSLWHNSQQSEAPANKEEEQLFVTCVRCHSAGKIFSYRMTPENWAKVRDFHFFVDPAIIFQMREMHWIPEADAALANLAKSKPYGKAWSAPAAKLDGTWGVVGYQPGKASFRGEATIADAGNAEYKLSGTIKYADGTLESFSGDATLYGGYALRTRTTSNGIAVNGAWIVAGDEITGESHFPAPDFRTSSAVWVRKGGAAKVAKVSPSFLVTGERSILTVDGVNLPDVKAADVAFAGGPVKVLAATRVSPEVLQLQVVSGAEKLTDAKLTVKGLAAGSVKLAPRIDGIAVTPPIGRARLSGGPHYPSEGVQFQAVAQAKVGSGKKATLVDLGPVPATFTLAEEKTRPDDDDLLWVGAIQPNGRYVPMGDCGPNPSRACTVENSGFVKVLARYKTFNGQGQLAVVPPDYIQRIR